jgi:hypothetical protein
MSQGDTRTAVDLRRNFKNYTPKRGQWRMALFAMAHRREEEREFTPEEIAAGAKHPLPKNSIDRAAYMFLEQCETGDVNYIKELGNRLDGLPSQDITLQDRRDLDNMTDEQLNAAAEALRAIITAQDSSAGTVASGKPEPIG